MSLPAPTPRPRRTVLPTLALAALALSACSVLGDASAPVARVDLKPTAGSKAAGKLTLRQVGDKLRISGQVSGLTPNAMHGFHVHEKGDCTAPDGMSAGGHFNPAGQPHAHFDTAMRHAGDMPNLQANADGVAFFAFDTDLLKVEGPASVIGRAFIVHRDPDDYKTQPTGNSGPRLACGVVTAP